MTIATFFGWNRPFVLIAAAFETVGMMAGLGALWWFGGRDRWLGDDFGLTQRQRERIKPLFSNDTIVPQFAPPEIPGEDRVLRPAEVGVLLRERIEDIDISATLIDLAIRNYIRLEEIPIEVNTRNARRDYRLIRLRQSDRDLQYYERRLMSAIFDEGIVKTDETEAGESSLLLSSLSGTLWIEMNTLKNALSKDIVSVNKLFAVDPDQARIGLASTVAPALAFFSLMALFGFGVNYGIALILVPLVFGFAALYLIGHAMPRRTGLGREMLRRSLGFRLFLLTAELDEVQLREEHGSLHEFLPYAMVMHCSAEWTKRLAGLNSVQRMPAWYKSERSITPEALEARVHDFAESMAHAIGQLPGETGR